MQDDEDPPDPEEPDESGEARNDGPPKPPSDVELVRWWRAYCDMRAPRPWTTLATIVGAQKRRVRKAVFEGWPELGIPAFKDREMAPNEAVVEVVARAQSAAIERVAVVVAGSWAEDARGHLSNLPKIGSAIAKLTQNLADQAESASFVRYRRVPDLDEHGKQRRDAAGNPLTLLKPYVNGADVALAAQRLAAAAKDHAVLNKALLDSLAPFRDSGIDFSDAPPEVLLYLQRKWAGRAA